METEVKQKVKCWACGVEVEGDNLCLECIEEGWWIDPAGGLHSPDEEPEDYARQYE